MIYEVHPPNQKPAPYTTRFGTTISSRILSELMESIAAGTGYQLSITDHLRDAIPAHDEDLDEAMEVYNHAKLLILQRHFKTHGTLKNYAIRPSEREHDPMRSGL